MKPNSVDDNKSWCTGALPGFIDFPISTKIINSKLDDSNNGSIEIPPADIGRPNYWQDWADHFITDNDALAIDWNELLEDARAADSIPEASYEIPQPPTDISTQQAHTSQKLPDTLGDICNSGCPCPSSSANAASGKQRMRWTPELHEAFAEAVNTLGGIERATPKGVIKLMKVEGLTVYHVKSHLQKYRTARYRPETIQEPSEKHTVPIEDLSSLDFKTGIEITEALQLQMEVQKRLHEQLEIQRNLQLRIEEQGRNLQMMFEKQCKYSIDLVKESADNLSKDTYKEEPESQVASEKQKAVKLETPMSSCGEASDFPPTKRAKVDV